MRFIRTLFVLVALATITSPALAEMPDHPVGYVSDFAHLMSEGGVNQLDRTLKTLEDTTPSHIQLFVATVDSLDGEDIDMYGVELGRKWGVGQAKKDNGILITIAKEEHKSRIDVGYHLEGTITDLKSKLIVDAMDARFKEGDFDGGVQLAVKDLTNLVKGEPTGDAFIDHPELKEKQDALEGALAILFFGAIFTLIAGAVHPIGGGVVGGITGFIVSLVLGLSTGGIWFLIVLGAAFGVGLSFMARAGLFDAVFDGVSDGSFSSSGFSSGGGGFSSGFSGGGGGSFGGGGASGSW